MPVAGLARHLSEFRQINNNMRSLELDNQYLDEGLTDWLRNIAMAAALAAGGETAADAKKITVTPDGKAYYTDTGEPVKPRGTAPTPAVPKPGEKPGPGVNKGKPQTSLLKVQANTPEERKNLLKKMAVAAGIQGAELTQFLAQSSHETRNFETLEETGAVQYLERKYGPDSRKGTILGNTRPGDGARYRGRGFLQLTGKYNYHQIGKKLGLDLVNHPDMVAKYPGVAAATAIAYWKWRVAPKVQSFSAKGATEKVTRQIAGTSAEKHLQRRKQQLKKFQKKP